MVYLFWLGVYVVPSQVVGYALVGDHSKKGSFLLEMNIPRISQFSYWWDGVSRA